MSAGEYIPQSAAPEPLRRAQLFAWGALAALMLAWMALIVGAPFAEAHGYVAVAQVIYKAFDPLCHQISERSFHLEGHPFAVCARCTGLYVGLAAGIIFYPLARSLRRTDTPSRVWLMLAVIPISIDWSLGFFGIWANTHLSRFLTGALLGVVAALFIVPGVMDMLRYIKSSASGARLKPQAALAVAPDRIAPSDYGSPSSRI